MSGPEAFGARPFRLALAFAVAVSLATVAAFALIYFAVASADESRIGVILADVAQRNAEASADRLRAALTDRQTPEIRRIDYLALFDARDALEFGNLPRLPPIAIDGRPHFVNASQARDFGAAPESAIFVARRRNDGAIVVFGRNLQDTYAIENTLLRALGLALAPTVAVILGIGAWFARRASRRLARIHDAIARVMQGEIEQRLPAAPKGDEIDRMAEAVNLMLDEIVRLLDQIRSVGDNIAHDLRAPLTLARIKLDRALETCSDAARPQLEAAVTQLERAGVTIAALLRISAVENGPRDKHFRDVDLSAVCAQAVDFYEPAAEAKSVSLTASLEGPFWIRGDEDLLREAVANLVDNAVKFTPPGGAVQVAAFALDGEPCVEVRDTGPGVAPADRELIFRRFYRAAAGAAHPGHGLGLSIARNIAELHGFQLRVEDGEPGARFVMRSAAKASLARSAR
jgi:signal transduction histidine kinase